MGQNVFVDFVFGTPVRIQGLQVENDVVTVVITEFPHPVSGSGRGVDQRYPKFSAKMP